MYSIPGEDLPSGWDPTETERLERLTANAKVATVLGSKSVSSDTVDFWGAADKAVLNKVHKKPKKLFKYAKSGIFS